MNKLILAALLMMNLPTMAMSQSVNLKNVEALSTPKNLDEVKKAYDLLAEAVKQLEQKPSDEMAIAILKGYASVGKKDPSYVGIEDLAPYFKKNSKKMTELAKKHLDKKDSEVILMALESMADTVGKGNDPSVN